MRFSFESKQFIETDIQAEKLAVIGENRALSWKAFQEEVNQLANFLTEHGWNNSSKPILIYGHKEAEMIVAIYTCMQLGITYIPTDVVYPKSRLERVASIAEVGLILNCSQETLHLPGTSELHLEETTYSWLQNNGKPVQLETQQVDPLVYIIFTSGSTGEPKGVQISREAVLSFLRWMTQDFGFSQQDVFINIALFSFDLSVYELMTFGALGATILLNGKTTVDQPEYFLARVAKYSGTVWVSTPSFAFLFSRDENAIIAHNVRYFLFCGEVLPHALAASLKKYFPNTILYNTYGPTEATVATTLVEITPEILANYPSLPVGYSKRESQLEFDGEEIVIIGPNVSVGYLNRPDLNAEKFGVRNGQRAFKTGDLGYLENGMLFCKGRNDDQVKLRGYRIELNEITAKIDAITFVAKSETIALKRNNEVKKIVSLVQLKETEDRDYKQAILNELATNLPDYMVPSDIKIIPAIPLNQNGKADKQRLTQIYLGQENP